MPAVERPLTVLERCFWGWRLFIRLLYAVHYVQAKSWLILVNFHFCGGNIHMMKHQLRRKCRMRTLWITCGTACVTEIQTSQGINEQTPQSTRLQHLKNPNSKIPYAEDQTDTHLSDVTCLPCSHLTPPPPYALDRDCLLQLLVLKLTLRAVMLCLCFSFLKNNPGICPPSWRCWYPKTLLWREHKSPRLISVH